MALISSMLTGFENIVIALAAVAAGVVVDVLAAWLQQSGRRRGARWAFGLAAPFVTSVIYLGAASMAAGRMPAVVELWTGAPIVMGLLGWALAALMLPNPLTGSADVVRS